MYISTYHFSMICFYDKVFKYFILLVENWLLSCTKYLRLDAKWCIIIVAVWHKLNTKSLWIKYINIYIWVVMTILHIISVLKRTRHSMDISCFFRELCQLNFGSHWLHLYSAPSCIDNLLFMRPLCQLKTESHWLHRYLTPSSHGLTSYVFLGEFSN